MSIYSVYILLGQRTCRYEGEHAPEVIAAADEFINDDNPDYLKGEKEAADKTKEFDNTVVVRVDLPFDLVAAAVNPQTKGIPGAIITP